MSTVLIYDSDFFHYPNVIPNLECMKLSAYCKKRKDITVFSNNLDPERYTKVYFRKDYDDGQYNPLIIKPNVSYGGRAFSKTYKSLGEEIERVQPEVDIYQKYSNLFLQNKNDEALIKKILNAGHHRILIDNKLVPYEGTLNSRCAGLIVHDYDLARVEGATDLLADICSRRIAPRPFGIGNKFPIDIYKPEEFSPWLKIQPMPNLFYMKYNGIIPDELLIEMVESDRFFSRNILYNASYGCSDEDDFLKTRAIQLFRQVTFLRRNNAKILLDIDEEIFKTAELKNFIRVLTAFCADGWGKQRIRGQQTFYHYCSVKARIILAKSPWQKKIISYEELINMFQYIRVHNYELFDLFYQLVSTIPKGGKLVNDWLGSQNKNRL